LSHGILSETSSTKANALAERTNPALVLAAIKEVDFILSFETEGAELPIADIVFLL
jgi:hypothetical protein